MASILYIDKMAPQTSKTIGQAVNNAVTYGLGLMVGFFLNGYLYEKIGSFALFSISCLIALAGGGDIKRISNHRQKSHEAQGVAHGAQRIA